MKKNKAGIVEFEQIPASCLTTGVGRKICGEAWLVLIKEHA
jgi:hypothetical protein